jgi:hypothetical protein
MGRHSPKNVIVREDVIVPEGWTIMGAERHADRFPFWMSFIFSLLTQTPSVENTSSYTYTIRCEADGTVMTVRLPGDHQPDALLKYLQARLA